MPFLPPVPANSLCEDGDLRLDTRDAIVGGRLDVCYDGIWGSVCNEMWTDLDVRVACNQLGLPSTGESAITFTSHDNTMHLFI